jgi:cell division protein ZapA
MAAISIKIRILEREYPMRVEASEEEYIRLAAKQLNDALKEYRQNFGIEDRLDLLAMVAFDAWIEKLRTTNEHELLQKQLSRHVADLDEKISRELGV